jgi:amino acid transporter
MLPQLRIMGSGIFGLPGELTHLLGRASPIAMLFGALVMAIIMAAITEVSSQFSEGGAPTFMSVPPSGLSSASSGNPKARWNMVLSGTVFGLGSSDNNL